MVKTAFFQPAEPQPGPATAPMADLEPAFEDATVNLRRLAQLRDAGVITEAEFQAKKEDLLAGHRAARRQRSWYSGVARLGLGIAASTPDVPLTILASARVAYARTVSTAAGGTE